MIGEFFQNKGHDLNQSKMDRLKEQAYDKFNMILSNVVIAYGEVRFSFFLFDFANFSISTKWLSP